MSVQEIYKLEVKYHNRTVGILFDDGKRIGFQYDRTWQKDGFSISPLSLPLCDEIFYTPSHQLSDLFGVFRDSLPDGWGQLLSIRALNKQGINYNKLLPLTKLSLIHANGPGALTYEPIQNETKLKLSSSSNPLVRLDEIAQDAIKIYHDENLNLDELYLMAGSSGGARPKIYYEDQQGSWIIKFSNRLDDPEAGWNEYQLNQKAQQCGINVNEHKLFPSQLCKGYFGAKRFDITPNHTRIHFISLCGLLETIHTVPNLDYMILFQVIDSISVQKDLDKLQAYKLMCFNVLNSNKDDHGKNFGFIYDEQLQGYKLSPAYDITSININKEHEMSVDGIGYPTEADCLRVGTLIGYSKSKCLDIINAIKGLKDKITV